VARFRPQKHPQTIREMPQSFVTGFMHLSTSHLSLIIKWTIGRPSHYTEFSRSFHREFPSKISRPPKTTCRTRRIIVWAAKKKSRQELRDLYAPHVSIATVDRSLHDAGIPKWLVKKPARLTSDECSAERITNPKQKCVFRTLEEKWHSP
jgi:hypothetical protein